MIRLGNDLVRLAKCTSCMDNTDGIGQSLLELSENSGVKFVVDRARVTVPALVARVADVLQIDPLSLAFGPGADFSLVGTLVAGVDESHIPSGLSFRLSDTLKKALVSRSSMGESVGHWRSTAGITSWRHRNDEFFTALAMALSGTRIAMRRRTLEIQLVRHP